MIAECEDELICDFAETYGVYDYTALPPSTAAVLAVGLRENSRVKMKLSGQKLTLEQGLMALILDSLNINTWMHRGKGKRPKSIFKQLTEPQKPKDELRKFASAEAFDEWLARKQRAYNNG